MRTFHVPSLCVIALCALAGACGSDDGTAGPPSVEKDSTTEPVDGDSEEVTGEPGSCRKLCCSDAECPGGACEVFDSEQGTLGVCTTSTVGTTPPAVELSASCWNDPELECNPLTSSGCEAGDACDAIDDDPDYPVVVGCAGGETSGAEGDGCDAAWGPWCAPGLHCVRN